MWADRVPPSGVSCLSTQAAIQLRGSVFAQSLLTVPCFGTYFECSFEDCVNDASLTCTCMRSFAISLVRLHFTSAPPHLQPSWTLHVRTLAILKHSSQRLIRSAASAPCAMAAFKPRASVFENCHPQFSYFNT